jgi:hypothetical protein
MSVFAHPQRVKDKIFSFYTTLHANYYWNLVAFQFFLVKTATMLNRESLVLAIKHRYTNLGVATKIVRSKDGKCGLDVIVVVQ